MDEATPFQAAHRLNNMSIGELWCPLKVCWINVYLGSSDIITHDAGSNFVSRAFQQNVDLLHINYKEVVVEASNRMSLVERYHEPLPREFSILREKCPKLSFDEVSLAVTKSIKNNTGPDGLILTLLVFGAIPRIGTSSDPPHPDIAARAIAVTKATKKMSIDFLRR